MITHHHLSVCYFLSVICQCLILQCFFVLFSNTGLIIAIVILSVAFVAMAMYAYQRGVPAIITSPSATSRGYTEQEDSNEDGIAMEIRGAGGVEVARHCVVAPAYVSEAPPHSQPAGEEDIPTASPIHE
jgi:hypothetical protein